MGFATTRTITLAGAVGHVVDVQADVSPGTVGMTVVGRADAAISEGRDRCRMALINSDLNWPGTRRVTWLLSPADVPKQGTHLDLAMAVSILGATGEVPTASLEGAAFIGELTLDGRLRPLHGVLPMTMAAAARGLRTVYVPEPQADEAALVPGVSVFGVRSVRQVWALLNGVEPPVAAPVEPMSGAPLLSWRGQERLRTADLADVRGMADARFAIEVAAAGAHHLLLSGPKGAGKTTLAERIPGVLPDLDVEEALELTAIHSLAGCLDAGEGLIRRPPFSAPHSTSTRASLLGGGTGRVRPGEVSRAHAGVLFLDEFPLFNTDIVQALRQPLESGDITIGRGDEVATFPARGMVVLAANPCPCGEFRPFAPRSGCTCSEVRRREYRRKLTGPIADRIDITRHIEPPRTRPSPVDPQPETTAAVRERVTAARRRQAERYAGLDWRTNAQVPGPALMGEFAPTADAAEFVEDEVYAGRLTRRGATRVLRLAWTVADLAETPVPGRAEAEIAVALRSGAPLPASVTSRVAS